MYFSCDYVYRRMGIAWEKKYPYYGKFMSTNFPGSPYTMGFVTFWRTMENWCENPCIFHMVTLVHFFLWLRVNMYYFHTCIYINPILLWQSLSSRCVVDYLWKLTLGSLLCFLRTLFFMCNVQPYKCMGCHKAIVMITVGHIVFILHIYIYIYIYIYIIYTIYTHICKFPKKCHSRTIQSSDWR